MYKNHYFLLFLLWQFFASISNILCIPPRKFSNISDDSITLLYKCSEGCQFYIPQENFVDQDFERLKETLKKYEFNYPKVVDWENAISKLKKRAQKKDAPKLYLNPEKLLTLLNDAKTLLKSFLLENDDELPSIQQNYIKKSRLRRLFTYAKLQQVIDEKQLNHVRLPRKILVIQNQKTGSYLSSNDAKKIIDDNLKIFVDPEDRTVNIDLAGGYEEVIYAQKETDVRKKSGFTKNVMKELYALCREAPFDIGFDNIFEDSNGDAVIIDTEYKKTGVKDCEKLGRYGKQPEPEQEPKAQAQPEPEPKISPEPQPESQPKTKAQPEPKPQPAPKPITTKELLNNLNQLVVELNGLSAQIEK